MSIVQKTRPASKPTRKPKTVEQIIATTPVVPATPDPWYDGPDAPADAPRLAGLRGEGDAHAPAGHLAGRPGGRPPRQRP